MKQILQNLKDGRTELAEVPSPRAGRGCLLIHTPHSLISSGTERMLVAFGKANLIDKARQQPDKVRMVLDKVTTDGLMPTIEAVFNKLDRNKNPYRVLRRYGSPTGRAHYDADGRLSSLECHVANGFYAKTFSMRHR